MYLEREGKHSGVVGEKTDLVDTLGNNLYVGDIVLLVDNEKSFKIQNYCVIVRDFESGKYHVMGLYSKRNFDKSSNWNLYRAIPFSEIPEGFYIDSHTYRADKKEITIAEIEKELGYSIKIIKD